MNLLFCRPSWLISALTKTHHWIVSLASSIRSTPSHPSCLTSVSILFISIPKSQEWFLWVLMTKYLYAHLISFIHVTLLCCHIFPDIIAFIILYQEYKSWSSLLCNCCYFFLLRSKYFKLFFSHCKSVLFPDISVLLGEKFLLFFKTFFLILGKRHSWWCLGASFKVFMVNVWSNARLGSHAGVQSCLNAGLSSNCPCTIHTWV